MQHPDNCLGQTYNHHIRATTLCLSQPVCAASSVSLRSHLQSFIIYNLWATTLRDRSSELQTLPVTARERERWERRGEESTDTEGERSLQTCRPATVMFSESHSNGRKKISRNDEKRRMRGEERRGGEERGVAAVETEEGEVLTT